MTQPSATWLRLVLSGKFNRQSAQAADASEARSNAPPVAFEDQVVAAVFAELGWIDDGRGLLPFLTTSDELGTKDWLRLVRQVHVELWPWWSEARFSVEPDAVLRFELDGGEPPRLMTVEAKLAGTLEPGQLLRQQLAGREHAKEEKRKFEGVLYVTDDYERPPICEPNRPDLEQSLDVSEVFWCSWRSLRHVIPVVRERLGARSSRESAVLDDLARALSYWGLEPFDGVKAPSSKALHDWAESANFGGS